MRLFGVGKTVRLMFKEKYLVLTSLDVFILLIRFFLRFLIRPD